MKNFKLLIISCLCFIAALNFTACKNNQATDTEGKEYTSAYVCPMHCEGSGSDKEGVCPVCKMDYVTKEEHEKRPHTH